MLKVVRYCQIFHPKVHLWLESGPRKGGKPRGNASKGTSLLGVKPCLCSHDVIKFGIKMSDTQIIYRLSIFLKDYILLRLVVSDIFCIVSLTVDLQMRTIMLQEITMYQVYVAAVVAVG